MGEPTCKDLIGMRLQAREIHLRELMEVADAWGDGARPDPESEGEWLTPEGAEERLHEFGLGVSARVVVRVELSTGGPADWVEAVCAPTSRHAFQSRDAGVLAYVEPVSMTYHYADWWDHAETEVLPDSSLWRWVEGICECGVEL